MLAALKKNHRIIKLCRQVDIQEVKPWRLALKVLLSND